MPQKQIAKFLRQVLLRGFRGGHTGKDRVAADMCPDLVIAARRITAESPRVKAEAYDVSHFEQLKKRYNVMSVPCMIINDEMVTGWLC